MIDEKEYAEVEFHSTPETTGKDPLNILRLCCSTNKVIPAVPNAPSTNQQVGFNQFKYV